MLASFKVKLSYPNWQSVPFAEPVPTGVPQQYVETPVALLKFKLAIVEPRSSNSVCSVLGQDLGAKRKEVGLSTYDIQLDILMPRYHWYMLLVIGRKAAIYPCSIHLTGKWNLNRNRR